ncbi:hypothetical protein ACFTZI_06770 [Streptomyces decoyicus]|uniref:hypothetical protein n=1 Tax=Streptomyces decoyicus TaxID=249567 RepID=UPI003625A77A
MDALSEPSGGHPDGDAGVLVRDIVRDVVAATAPDEMVLLEGLLRSDDDSAVARLSGRRRSREPLGFGLHEVTALVTPVVWLVLDEAARKVVGAAVTGAATRSRTLLRRISRRPAAPTVMPPLTPDQLESVRLRVLELGAESGLEPGTVTALAERVVARLVLRPPDQLTAGGTAGDEPEA